MPRKKPTGPTQREAEILTILWERGETSVEEIRRRLRGKPSANTVRTLLGIMVERKLVAGNDKTYGRQYRALAAKGEVQRSALRRLVDTLFAGSAEEAVLCMVEEGEIDAAKLAELQQRLRAK